MCTRGSAKMKTPVIVNSLDFELDASELLANVRMSLFDLFAVNTGCCVQFRQICLFQRNQAIHCTKVQTKQNDS